MSVYTSITTAELIEFLSLYDLGELVSFRGIEGGIENTNYFVTTAKHELVLTIFEELTRNDINGIIGLALQLESEKLTIPVPLADKTGRRQQTFKDKPAVLCHKLSGQHVDNPGVKECRAIGVEIAKFHAAARDYLPRKIDLFSVPWWIEKGPQLTQNESTQDYALFKDEVALQKKSLKQWEKLPKGWVHSDLFHDNALFDGDKVAIIDLYSACEGAFIYDLAVIANDWCCDLEGEWKPGCLEALLAGYNSVRQLDEHETQAWGLALRVAALRWWIGRLDTKQLQAKYQGELALQKDPNEYRIKLQKRRLQFAR
ncbi:MAG: homoserine kinase [Venatoribacter sp.]